MDKTNFERDGIVWPIRAIDEMEAAGLEGRYRKFQAEIIRRRGRETHIKPHLVSTWLDGIAHHPVVVGAVATALGPDILLWTSDFAIKEAGQGTWVPWHQDTPYWNLSTTEVVSVWFALTPATRENGAMKVFPGTHKSGTLGHINFEGDPHAGYKIGQRTASKGNLFAYDHVMNQELDETQAVDVELQPGEFSIHSVELVHGGGPNESSQDRIGFVMRFISTATHCRTGRDSATLVQGQYHGAHFELEPRPQADFTPEAMVAMERALAFPSGFGDRLLK